LDSGYSGAGTGLGVAKPAMARRVMTRALMADNIPRLLYRARVFRTIGDRKYARMIKHFIRAVKWKRLKVEVKCQKSTINIQQVMHHWVSGFII
jgi:hypothetical protein